MKNKFVIISAIIAICLFFTLNASAQKGKTKDGFYYRVENGAITIFRWKNNVPHVVVPDAINGLPVVEIANRAFYNNKKLQSVVLPEGLVTISSWAFENDNIKSIVFPESLVTIGSGAFSENNIERIVIPKNVKLIGLRAFEEGLTTVEIPSELAADAILNIYPYFHGWFEAFGRKTGTYTYKDNNWYLDGNLPTHTAKIEASKTNKVMGSKKLFLNISSIDGVETDNSQPYILTAGQHTIGLKINYSQVGFVEFTAEEDKSYEVSFSAKREVGKELVNTLFTGEFGYELSLKNIEFEIVEKE